MLLSLQSTDRLIAANAPQLAARILQHPASLLLGRLIVHALVTIAHRDPPGASPQEYRLLQDAVALVDAVEIRLGQEARA